MIVYLFNLMWTLSMSILATVSSKMSYDPVLEKEKRIPNMLFVLLILISFISFYALRWMTGTDFVNYYALYYIHGNNSVQELIGTRDWGFTVLTSIIYKISPDNFLVYNFILAALTYVPVVLTYRKNSNFFTFSMMLYVMMMIYYWPYNGVRQSIAAGICFFAFPLLYKKAYFKYSLFIFVAYLFHSTALIMLPLAFIVTKRAWSKSIIMVLVILSLSFIGLPSMWDNLIRVLELIGQEKLANDYSSFDSTDNGVSLLRILVYLIPVVISFFYYNKLKKNNPQIDLLINMSLMCVVFMIFGSQLTVIARLSNYFIFFNALLIPEFSTLFRNKEKVFFYFLTLTLFFIYMCLLLPIDSDLLPYKFIFRF